MFFGKVKYINTPAEFELVTFRLEVRHNMKMSQTTLSCEWVFINTMLWDLDSLYYAEGGTCVFAKRLFSPPILYRILIIF